MATPFDYHAFIAELRGLIARAKVFGEPDRGAETAVFRRWHHEVGDLIDRVNRLRYDINTDFRSRAFRVMSYGASSRREQLEAFNRDLDDTLHELQVVVDRFERYGDPKAKPTAATAAPVAAAKAPDLPVEAIRAACPQCRREQRCVVRGNYHTTWHSETDDGRNSSEGADTYFILQCGGCELVFFQTRGWSSEEAEVAYHPLTGEVGWSHPEHVATFSEVPQPLDPAWARADAEVIAPLLEIDRQLASIMREVYQAQGQGALILASVGLRTALDRATELLQIHPGNSIEGKVVLLCEQGFVGETEARVLGVVADAGNAAAHRGWCPELTEFKSMLEALEHFIRRTVLKGGAGTLAVAGRIPARHPRPPKEDQPRRK